MLQGVIRKFSEKKRDKPFQGKNRISLPAESPKRILGNLLILLVIAAISAILITIRDDLVNKKIDNIMNDFYAFSLKHGWAVDDILIQGRQKTTLSEIKKQIPLDRNNNILQIDLQKLKNGLEELPWVKSAEIRRRFFPNILQINLQEKKVIALWQYGNKFYPVDSGGNLIDAVYTPHQPVLVIVGRKAPEKINDLLKITSTTPELHQRIKAAVLYAGRRWDVIFDDIENGITVKLPEKDIKQAWEKFSEINTRHGLLKRKLTIIDLRYQNKISVTIDDSEAFDE